MQLGTRWAFGAALPSAVPFAAGQAVSIIESDRRSVLPASVVEKWYWTLTYLEGRAHLELEDGTQLIIEPSGATRSSTMEEEDEDW